MISNEPASWDIETDFVSIGSGIGGLSAAIAAAEHGLEAVVLEKAEQLGGVTALSMGEVWVAGNRHMPGIGVEDSVESGFRYLKRLSMDYGSDAAILNFTAHAPVALNWFEDTIGLKMMPIRGCPDYYYQVSNDGVPEGRMLEVAPFPGASLGEWAEKTRLSQMPYGMTHADIDQGGGVANMIHWDFAKMAERLSADERCLGCGLAAYFVKGALDRGVTLMTGTGAVEIYADGTRVTGVRAQQDGKDITIRARKGVLVAVSSYERRQDYNKTVGQQLELGSIVSISAVDGASFRLTGPLGARTARVPDITSLGFIAPGEEDGEGFPIWRSALQIIGQPHIIVVNRAGRRFGNEAFYRSFYYNIDRIDGLTQTHPNMPCFMVFDSQARAKYPIGSILPGMGWPEGLGCVADTLEELASKTGIDAAALRETVATFNEGARQGRDPAFGRGEQPWSFWMCGDKHNKPNPVLGPVEQGPFYAVELKRIGGSGIPSTGILADEHGRALDWNNEAIPGLYVAGNSMARMETGAVMQSGISNARGMTYGWLAAKHAAGQPSDLLAKEAERLGL